MYLQNDMIVARIGDVTMRSYKSGDGPQYILDPTAVEGWDDGTGTRRDATIRLNSDGDFPEPANNSSRLITFSGTAIASTYNDMQRLRDNLTRLPRSGGYEQLSVQTKTGTRYVSVGVEGTTSWVKIGDLIAAWRITFYAPDPFIYGAEQTVTLGANVNEGGLKYPITYVMNYNLTGPDAAQTITNDGSVAAWPVVKVTGDYYSGFTVTDNKGNYVTYNGMITMTAPVSIDMARGIATQNGVDKSTFITKREWFSIPARSSIRPTYTPLQNGSGWCDIIYRDTWI